MQFIDLQSQQKRILDQIERNVRGVLQHGKYIMGPEVNQLEEALGAYVGVRHAVGCSSGTDALLLSLMAYGVKPGDAIFTTPFTFIATAEVISFLGATPIFVDIDPDTFNINPERLDSAIAAVSKGSGQDTPLPRSAGELSPKGVIAVDIFGLPADYGALKDIAKKHKLFLIQDAAQSFGATHEGRKSCAQGDIGCTSFFPAKPLGCYGDGGMCFTDNAEVADHLRSLRLHGKGSHKYDNVCIGINGRLDTLQAAILLAKFSVFPEEVALRQEVARRYTELLSDCSSLKLQTIPNQFESVWAQYSILAKNETKREILQTKLKGAGIPTAVYYPRPLHLQTAFLELGYSEGDFPISEEYAQRIFSIPMHPYLTLQEQENVVRILTGRSA